MKVGKIISDVIPRFNLFNTNSGFAVGPIELQPYAVNNNWFGDNLYFDGAAFRRRAAGYGTLLQMYNGQLIISGASTGTAASVVSPTAILKTDFNGNVVIGGSLVSTLGTFTGGKLMVNTNGIIGIANNMYIGDITTSPTAYLHLKAGTAAAGTSPLKLTPGVINATAEPGAIEFDSTYFYVTNMTERCALARVRGNVVTLDFPSTAAQTSSALTMTVTGAAVGDVVSLGTPVTAINANSMYTAYVSASNTITVIFNKYSSVAIDPASGSFKAYIIK